MINNLLIDLGGVLYEIDIAKTLDAFRALQAPGAQVLDFSKQNEARWFSLLDIGQTDFGGFAEGLKAEFQVEASQEQIRQIWLDLLIGLFPGRVEQVRQLAKRYHIALLSNTSQVHFNHYEPECRPIFEQMDHVFVSFEMGVRKPDPGIYTQALETAGWKAEETLFLDDSHKNILGAQAVGLQTAWIETPEVFDQVVGKLLA